MNKVDYRREIYQSEHASIVDADLWNPQKALPAGCFFCKSCGRPMVPRTPRKKGDVTATTFAGAREKVWQSCPTKSVPATLVEGSVVAQLGVQLRLYHTRIQLQIPESDLRIFYRVSPRHLFLWLKRSTMTERMERWQSHCDRSKTSRYEYTYDCRFKIPSRSGRALPVFQVKATDEPVGRAPRMARLVALAHKLEALVRSAEVKDYAEAGLGHVSPARIARIVILGQLASESSVRVTYRLQVLNSLSGPRQRDLG